MLSRILIFVGGLLVIALVGALVAPLFVDWTDFRKDFEREASRIIGKPVVVHGRVDARLIPFPSVTLNDVRVGQSDDGEPLIQVARFSMDAELAPFLSGEALIFDMRLEEPRARIKLLDDGTLDWARGKRSAIPTKSVVLENVSVTGGSIDFIDEQTGRTRRIAGLSADLSAKALSGPWRIEGRATLDGEPGSFSFSSSPLDADGALGLRARLMPDNFAFGVDLAGDLKVVDLRPLYTGTFTLLETKPQDAANSAGAVRPPRVTGAFELTNERIRVPEYRVELGPTDDPYVITGEATLDTGKVPEFLLVADGQQIDVSRFGNTGEAAKTDRDPAISVRQRLASIMAIAADIPIPQVPGRASLRLPAIVIGDTTVREVRLDVRPDGSGWQVDDAVAILPGRTQLEAKGRLTLRGERSFRGDLLIASNQPSGLATWLAGSVDPAIRKLRTAGFSAVVNLTDTLQQFERLEIAAGPAALNGRLERQSPEEGPPSLSIELKGNHMDLEALRALTGLVAGDASTETVLSHSIAASLSADRFSAFGEEASKVEAVLTLKNGQLQAERVSIGDLAGAQLALSGRMGGTLAAPVVSAKVKVATLDVTPLFELIGRHVPAHPALKRLIESGGYYRDAALDITLTAGSNEGNAPASFGIIGTANGSRIAARYQAPNFAMALTGQEMLLEATLENPSTRILLGQAGADPLPFDADANGILSVKLQGLEDGKAAADLTFATEGTQAAAKGTVDLAAERFLEGNGRVTITSGDAEPYLLMRGIALPDMGTGLPLTAAADVAVTAEAVALSNIEGKADRNAFTGALSIDRTSVNPRATGQVSLDTLDLPWLAGGILGPVEDLVSGELSQVPLAASSWAALDVRLDVAAKQFWPGLYGPINGFAGKLAWSGEDIDLKDASGDWLGGKVAGTLRLGNGAGSGFLQSRLDITGADLAAVGWAVQGQPVATGKATLSLALEASGPSVAAMAESMSGSGVATLDEVTVNGLNAGALPAIIAGSDAIAVDISPESVKSAAQKVIYEGSVPLGKVTVPLTIAGGVVRAQNVAASGGGAGFVGDISVDLPAQRIDASLAISFDAGEEALAGAQPALQLGFEGVLRSPGVSLDVTDLANFLSLRAFERERRRVETLQANVLEKQRLRREVALFRFEAAQREAAVLRAIEEESRRKAAQQEAARLKAEADAAAQAARDAAEAAAREAAQQGATEGLSLPGVTQPESLPGVKAFP